jgi:signal transduction histidine kinase
MKRLGITAKFVFGSACILVGLGLAVTWYSVSQLHGLLYQQMSQRVEAQTLSWIEANAPQILLSGDPDTLARLVGDLKKREGIAYVILLDTEGRQSAAIGLLQGLMEERRPAAEPDSRMHWRDMKDVQGLRYYELATPISASGTGMSTDLEAMFGVAAQKSTLGELRVGVDRQEFERGVNDLSQQNIALASVLTFLAIGLSFMFAKQMVTPLTLIGRAANRIAGGDLSERVLQGINLKDEVGDLVRNFNQMAMRLEQSREEMDLLYSGLEEKVRERTKELEQANRRLQELDQLKSDFLSTVSHELRTPLTSIKAYAEILLESPAFHEEKQKRFLGIIEKETDRMARLIADLLNLAKIESGTFTWIMGHAELREICRLSAELLAPNALEKTIQLAVATADPQWVLADSDRIQEVVANLLSNAIKFCSRGGHIELRLDRVTTSGPHDRLEGDYVRVAVTDDGPGILPHERERVFERFYQGGRNRVEESGTGLGLTISREIVLHHGGEIWVESEPGAGSTFCFTLPSRLPADAARMQAAESAKREV